jgi:hypothetical protein
MNALRALQKQGGRTGPRSSAVLSFVEPDGDFRDARDISNSAFFYNKDK